MFDVCDGVNNSVYILSFVEVLQDGSAYTSFSHKFCSVPCVTVYILSPHMCIL